MTVAVAHELVELAHDLARAVSEHDVDRLEELLASEFTLQGAAGSSTGTSSPRQQACTRSTSSPTSRSTRRCTGTPPCSSRGTARSRASTAATSPTGCTSPTSGRGGRRVGRSSDATRRWPTDDRIRDADRARGRPRAPPRGTARRGSSSSSSAGRPRASARWWRRRTWISRTASSATAGAREGARAGAGENGRAGDRHERPRDGARRPRP